MHDILTACLTGLSLSPPLRKPEAILRPPRVFLQGRCPSPPRRGCRGGSRSRPWHRPDRRRPRRPGVPPSGTPTGFGTPARRRCQGKRLLGLQRRPQVGGRQDPHQNRDPNNAVAELRWPPTTLALVGGGQYLKDRLAANSAAPLTLLTPSTPSPTRFAARHELPDRRGNRSPGSATQGPGFRSHSTR